MKTALCVPLSSHTCVKEQLQGPRAAVFQMLGPMVVGGVQMDLAFIRMLRITVV